MKEWSRKERPRKYFYIKAMYSRYIQISNIQEVVLTMIRLIQKCLYMLIIHCLPVVFMEHIANSGNCVASFTW